MTLDLQQLEADAQVATASASVTLVAVRKLLVGQVGGVAFTAGQATALREELTGSARLTLTAIKAVLAQLDGPEAGD